MGSVKKKSDQLGMPFGTASGRLKKMIMLRLLQRLGEDVCYRCGKKIETYQELSVDHKVDWLDVDPDLFWDLGNISFSHRECNRPGRNMNRFANREIPEGTSWCRTCKRFRPIDCFGPRKHGSTRTGKRSECNDCRRACNWERGEL